MIIKPLPLEQEIYCNHNLGSFHMSLNSIRIYVKLYVIMMKILRGINERVGGSARGS